MFRIYFAKASCRQDELLYRVHIRTRRSTICFPYTGSLVVPNPPLVCVSMRMRVWACDVSVVCVGPWCCTLLKIYHVYAFHLNY